MRWALSREVIPCFSGFIPPKPSRNTVEGILLHELIEGDEQNLRRNEGVRFRPRQTLRDLVEVWEKTNAANPRIDSHEIAGQLRIEEILSAFASATSYSRDLVRHYPSGVYSVISQDQGFEGPERWLRDPVSKLCGRADLISCGLIIEFKSGKKFDYHVEQILFYGGLYMAATGKSPIGLRLIYTATDEFIDVQLPSRAEMHELLDRMRSLASTTEGQVLSSNIVTKLNPEACMYCRCRGMCDDYWKVSKNVGDSQGSTLCDYTPTGAAVIEPAAFGVYVRDNVLDRPVVMHIPQDVLEKAGGDIKDLRFLDVKAVQADTGVRLAITKKSEIYTIS
jgi:hypothetical protein